MDEVKSSLIAFVEAEIIPQYAQFDKAHQTDHVRTVIANSLELATHYPTLDRNVIYAAAAYHDLGLTSGRERHHLASGEVVARDGRLRRWFSETQIRIIKEAVEDHRASSDHEPRSIYGRIVAEADRVINPDVTLRRAIQYGLTHYPDLKKEAQFVRFCEHMQAKYAEGGYLKLWIPESPNAEQLRLLRSILADSRQLRQIFERIYQGEI